ncbi:MAG: SMP-30/gluconolactonase/LRE family protein [Pseudomonadales bacterium]
MSLDIRDQRFLQLADERAARQTLADNFGFTEGPIWHPTEQHLIFSDIPESKLYRWSESDGVSVHRDPSNMANGNTYDRLGRILSCEHASSRVTREQNGTLEILASHYDGKELNSPNDIVVRSDGSIFFTDPAFGRQAPHGVTRERELDFCGLYQITPDGKLTLLSKDFNTPNGLCLGLDEQTLFVADTLERHIRKFQFESDKLVGGEVFCSSPAPDGLKIDSRGYLYAGGPRGVGVYQPDDGTWLGNFTTPEFCANFAWGGTDLKTLFMTASTGLYRVPVKIPGIALF